jgi:hypothetical protein
MRGEVPDRLSGEKEVLDVVVPALCGGPKIVERGSFLSKPPDGVDTQAIRG